MRVLMVTFVACVAHRGYADSARMHLFPLMIRFRQLVSFAETVLLIPTAALTIIYMPVAVAFSICNMCQMAHSRQCLSYSCWSGFLWILMRRNKNPWVNTWEFRYFVIEDYEREWDDDELCYFKPSSNTWLSRWLKMWEHESCWFRLQRPNASLRFSVRLLVPQH